MELIASKSHIEKRDGGYFVAGSRVSLDSVVCAFLRGASPESIARSFPLISLEEVYGAIAFYLSRQAEIDDYLREGDAQFDALREAARESNALLYRKLEEARQQLATLP
jgi:uncharacterized protein (DUF433 family)